MVNIVAKGDSDQIIKIVRAGAIEVLFIALMEKNDTQLILAALDAIHNALRLSKRNGLGYLKLVEQYDGWRSIKSLYKHDSGGYKNNKGLNVKENAAQIVRLYFDHDRRPNYTEKAEFTVRVTLLITAMAFALLCIKLGAGERHNTHKSTKKTIYVKLSATKRLNGNQGKKLEGLISKSGVEDIELESKTGQPTVMNKMEASNGVVYVPVHIKGSEKAVQKAVVLIREAVGTKNVDEKIELPPTNTKQATAAPPVSSSAPTRMPKKKKKSSGFTSHVWSSICANWQSLRTTTFNTCQSSTNYNVRTTKAVFVIFVILSCKAWLSWEYLCKDPHKTCDVWADVGSCDKNSIEGSIQYRTVCRPLQTLPVRNMIFVVCSLLLSILFLSVMILLLFRGVCPKLILIVNFISRVLRMPYDLYQVTKIKQSIYIKSSQSKNLRGKKRKGIVNKSGVDDIQIDTPAVGDNYIPMHMSGSRQSVRKAIELIQEAVGTEHVSITKPSSTVSRPPNQEEDVPIESKTSASEDISNGSKPQQNLEESNTPETPVQCETINNNVNNLTKEVAVVETSPVNAVPKEEVPSEIGVNSCIGMTQETITEASMSSLNDRSNISKAYSNFTTLNENDPLLIFLRSQASCIKGSVDEFYTWLVKSEDIDSMMALKEAVNEDDYLNDMKVGDGGGSGIKGFKRKAFLRAMSEYFNDESDTKSTAEVHQSLPQCQKKNLSETLEPPEELVCPISLNLMTNDPVVAADGITYERASIEDWFKKSKAKICKARENLKQNPQSEADQRVVDNGVCSPVYGSKLENLSLVPHVGTRNMARAFDEKEEAGS